MEILNQDAYYQLRMDKLELQNAKCKKKIECNLERKKILNENADYNTNSLYFSTQIKVYYIVVQLSDKNLSFYNELIYSM